MLRQRFLPSFLAFVGAANLLPAEELKAPASFETFKIFIMMGQSNMLGFGKVGPEETTGTLEQVVKGEGKYPHLWSESEGWVERKDVRFMQVMQKGARMQILRDGLLAVSGNIGPELQFGHQVGDFFTEPVLLVKSCIGNRSLGWDLLPPGSERFEYGGKIFAGYGESPASWSKGSKPEPIEWYAGKQYDDDVANAKAAIARVKNSFPETTRFEIVGFVWWQGHKDQNEAHASRYEKNLVALIKSLRSDFDAPEAKFVCATIAFGGEKLAGHGLTVAEAQLAVSGESGRYPEFRDNVATIDARPFWRGPDQSPSRAGHHYNHNAETYLDVGNALGEAMVRLLSTK